MKTITPATSLTLAAALAATFPLNTPGLFAGGAEEKTEQPFPHVIQYELGAFGFLAGDQITITSVRGDRKHIEPGGSYLVDGSYTLASADSADLALFCTTRGPSGLTPVQDGQRIKITRGAGTFHLYETNLVDGWLHVSFYPDNSSLHGGVYFGEKGRENTIMRDQEWFREIGIAAKLQALQHELGSNVASREYQAVQQAQQALQQTLQALQHDPDRGVVSNANHALMAYLGNPVPPPADMDAKYTKEGLSNAVQLAARNAGITLKKLAIDDSEFPFLVGVICEGSDYAKLKAEITKMDGYDYHGRVGGDSNSDGSDTCNAFCIVPYSVGPNEARQQIDHRLMLRQQVFYSRLSARE
jgi:hypothetical protein